MRSVGRACHLALGWTERASAHKKTITWPAQMSVAPVPSVFTGEDAGAADDKKFSSSSRLSPSASPMPELQEATHQRIGGFPCRRGPYLPNRTEHSPIHAPGRHVRRRPTPAPQREPGLRRFSTVSLRKGPQTHPNPRCDLAELGFGRQNPGSEHSVKRAQVCDKSSPPLCYYSRLVYYTRFTTPRFTTLGLPSCINYKAPRSLNLSPTPGP